MDDSADYVEIMNDPLTFSQGECMECPVIWKALHPLDCADLECPGCGTTNTVRYTPEPFDKSPGWNMVGTREGTTLH